MTGPFALGAACPDETAAVQLLMATHGLHGVPADHVDAIASSLARLRKRRPPPARALASRDRQQALACIRSLLAHNRKPPRRAGTTDDRRRKLIELLNAFHAIVKLAAASGFNAVPVLGRLESGEYTTEDLASLQRAIEAIPAGSGAAASPDAEYVRLLRAGILVWQEHGNGGRYRFNDYNDPPTLDGPLPAFLRELIRLASLPMPTDDTLHKHLRKLKNL